MTCGNPVKKGELSTIKGRDQPPIIGNMHPGRGHSGDVNTVCLSTSRGMLYTAGECLGTTDFLKAWDLNTGECLQNLEGHSEGIFALAKSEELSLLFSASVDRTIRVWDMNTNECVKVLEGHTDKVRCLCWDEEEQQLFSGSHDNRILVWSADNWNVVREIGGHRDWISGVQICDGLVFSTSIDKTCKVWERSGKLLQTLSHDQWISSVCLFQGILVVGLGDASIVGWDRTTWERRWGFEAHKEHNPVSSIVRAGEDVLLTGSWDGQVREWTRDDLEKAGERSEPVSKVLEIVEDSSPSEQVLEGDIFDEQDLQ